MPLVMLGLSHNTGATVDVRESVAFTTPGALPLALSRLKERLAPLGGRCVLLSTCNRTELYVAAPHSLSWDDMTELFQAARGLSNSDKLPPHLMERRGHRVVEHLFRVAAGLESMVLGETDVVRQVREAYQSASEAGLTGGVLNPLFHKALEVAKRARTECDMGRGAFSIGHAAAEVARNIFGDSRNRTVLLLGAGKMSETTARHLAASGTTSVLVANRTHDRAVRLAEALNGQAIRYEEFGAYLAKTDVVICSTAAPGVVVTRATVEEALRHRRHRDPLFFIDIAVPRDVETSVGNLPNVFLYNVDDLRQLVEEDMKERRRRAGQAETIVRDEAAAFVARQRADLAAVPLISSLRAKHQTLVEAEMVRLRQRLPHLSEADLKAVEAALSAVGNKMLHEPTAKVREYAQATEPDSEAKMETVREVFGLEAVAQKEEAL